MIVYAQELVPGRVGLISGLFFGLAFGMGGLGAAAIGVIADHYGIVRDLSAVLSFACDWTFGDVSASYSNSVARGRFERRQSRRRDCLINSITMALDRTGMSIHISLEGMVLDNGSH